MATPDQLNPLLFGHDETEGLVALQHEPNAAGPDSMLLYVRDGDTVRADTAAFSPFVWMESPDPLTGLDTEHEIASLSGSGVFKHLVTLPSWKDYQAALKHIKNVTGASPSTPFAPYYVINDPVQQFLMASGRTLFKGMLFSDLRRMQLDIETYTAKGFEFPNPDREEDRIIAIALSDNTGWSEVLSGAALDEKALLQRCVEVIRERDPDVIEGHNIFRFDFDYISKRAKRHKVKLDLGRDGSKMKTRSSRFVIAEQTMSYPRVDIAGRHVIDTYFLSQAYDVAHRSLESLGLKHVARHFGVAADDRTYIDGKEIARVFETEPEKLMAYARDDVLETEAIGALLSPSYFVQAQMLPFTYQNVAVRGNGTKIDSLLLREYLRQGQAVPRPDEARSYAGGYTDIFFTGVARNVHHCDVRSLYPSLMLKDKIGPTSDDLGIFLDLLDYLRTFRLDAKNKLAKSTTDDERVYLDALQTTFKILINSFYGYLGFSQGRFNDFAAAEKITEEGRALLRRMIALIEEQGGRPIEIDTDGIYFVPPDFDSQDDLKKFRSDFQAALPTGIDIEFDGEYEAMFSYKMKNYALLDADGKMVIKGAALKSRGLEPFQRAYLQDWLRLIMEGRESEVPQLQKTYIEQIEKQEWPIRKLAKTERLQEAPSSYKAKIDAASRGRNAAYELALASEREYRAGDQITYYVTGTKKSVPVYANAKLVSDWDEDNRDENIPYYLGKANALFKKFGDTPQQHDSQQELGL